jgi:hypothetical protein
MGYNRSKAFKEVSMKKIFVMALIIACLPCQVLAAGMTTHMYMSDVALKQISDPELKKIMNDNRDAVLAGTIFPDSGNGLDFTLGYSKKDNYSGVTHWPPFTEAYLAYVAANCSRPYSDHCRILIAHFLGTCAHNLEDGPSHNMFQKTVFRKDPGSKHKVDMDSGLDYVLIEKYHRGSVLPKYVVPYDDLVKVFQSMGLPYTRQDMVDGNRVHRAALFAERVVAPSYYASVKGKIPWAVENIITAPGGVDYTGAVVAKYWDALWLRINGRDPEEMILAVYPEPAATNIDPQSSLFLMFNRPVQTKTVNRGTVILTGPDQKPVNAEVDNQSDGHSELNIFTSIHPRAALKPGETYTVSLTSGIIDLHGKPLPENYSWKFTTAPGTK